jgi:hypothetical protein
VDADDLRQHLILYCYRKWPQYRRAKGRPSTFLLACARNETLAFNRAKVRAARRDKAAASLAGPGEPASRGLGGAACAAEWDEARDEAQQQLAAPAEGESVEEWAARLYRLARHAFRARPRQGTRGDGLARQVVVWLVCRHLKLSVRGAQMYFAGKPKLIEAIGLRRGPAKDAFWRAKFATEKLRLIPSTEVRGK